MGNQPAIDYPAMGARIRQCRRQRQMTQAELSGMIGISESFLGHLERGTRIAGAFGLSVDALLTGLPLLLDASQNLNPRMCALNSIMRILSDHAEEWLPL